MRILHLINGLSSAYGGPSRSVVGLADAQSQRGHDVCVLSAGSSENIVRPKFALQKLVSSATVERRFSIATLYQVAKFTRQADVVHVHGAWAFPTLLALPAVRHGARLLVSPRGGLSPAALREFAWKKRPYFELVERAVFERADCVLAASDAEASDIQRMVPKAKIDVLPNGVDCVQIRSKKQTKTIGYLGRLHPFKRIEMLLEAVMCSSDIRLIIGGDGELSYVKSLKLLVERYGLTQRVFFAGYVNDTQKSSFIDSIDCLVLCSKSENFGIAILEGLAASRPAVVTPNLPWAQYCSAGVVVAESATAQGLALAFTHVFSDYDVRATEAARIAKSFTWAQIAENFEKLKCFKQSAV